MSGFCPLASSCVGKGKAFDLSHRLFTRVEGDPDLDPARADARVVLWAALWLLILALAGVGQWRRMEQDARTDGIEMSR